MSINQEVFVNGERELTVADTFIYETELYGYGDKLYYLADSKLVKSKQYVKDSVEYINSDKGKLRKVVTLLAAPESWLSKNKFKKE